MKRKFFTLQICLTIILFSLAGYSNEVNATAPEKWSVYTGEAVDGFIEQNKTWVTYANITYVFYSTASLDGYIARSLATGYTEAYTDENTTLVGQFKSGELYNVWRGYFSFDTSTLSSEYPVLNVTLRLKCAWARIDISNFTVQVFNASYGNSLTAEDWNSGLVQVGSWNTTNFQEDTYIQITLDADCVNVGGYTQFELNSSREGELAVDGREWLRFYTEEAGENYRPELHVTVNQSFSGYEYEYDVYPITGLKVGQDHDSSTNSTFVWRSYVSFDTNNLSSPYYEVVEAYLSLRGLTDYSVTDFNMIVYKAAFGDALTVEDWGCGASPTVSWNTANFVVNEYVNITLSADMIVKDGRSQFELRSDREGTVPSGDEYVVFHSGDSTSQPILYVKYKDYSEEATTRAVYWWLEHIDFAIGVVGIIMIMFAPTVAIYMLKNRDAMGIIYGLLMFAIGLAFMMVWLWGG